MALQGLRDAITRHAYELGDRASRVVETQTRDAAPVGEDGGGATRRSVRVRPSGRSSTSVSFIAEATTPQAKFSDEGTRAHRIEGKPLLAFNWKKIGRFVVLRHVNHPGNPPGNWFGKPMPGRWRDALQRSAR